MGLVELVRLDGEQRRQSIERIGTTEVYRLRGHLLPLVYLSRELGLECPAPNRDAPLSIVVLQAGDRQFGLVVDRVHDTEEIVVKPLAKVLKGIPVFAGATILGDGKVSLILDVMGLAQAAGVVAGARDRRSLDTAAQAGDPRTAARQALVLLESSGARRTAIPLAQVARLEEIPRSALEWTTNYQAIQYHGRILPLVRLAHLLPGAGGQTEVSDPMRVVVCSGQGNPVGLVVERILDIVEAEIDVQPGVGCPGILGSAVIQQRVTDLLDIRALVSAAGAV
ncbi:MAG TPA: chemotaxis protein CheW [Gemmataceae bacterium]|nr:chemotaxis protein CheW [Gemmataceae bacterium]